MINAIIDVFSKYSQHLGYTAMLIYLFLEAIKYFIVNDIYNRVKDGIYKCSTNIPSHLRNTGNTLEMRRLIGEGYIFVTLTGKPLNLLFYKGLTFVSLLFLATAAITWAYEFFQFNLS